MIAGSPLLDTKAAFAYTRRKEWVVTVQRFRVEIRLASFSVLKYSIFNSQFRLVRVRKYYGILIS